MVASLAIGLGACGGSDDGGAIGGAAPEANATPIPADIKALFDKIDDNCAGNDNGFLTRFDTRKFNPEAIMSEWKAGDKDKMGSDCSQERGYSTSREDGIAKLKEHLADKNEDTRECIATNLTPAERKKLDEIVADPTNLGVFANIHTGGDNPEACTYYEFKVFRKDGVLLELVFNFTD
jgi:hypothetical protein